MTYNVAMPQVPTVPENFFNVLRNAKNKRIYGSFWLGLKGGTTYLGTDVEASAKRILDTMEAAKYDGLKIGNSKVIIKSTQGYYESQLNQESLSLDELKQLVEELNQRRDIFLEGEVSSMTSRLGKEKR